MQVSTITHIQLEGAALKHHCAHADDRYSWILNGLWEAQVYFTGTVEELKAFGQHLQETAEHFTPEPIVDEVME